MNGYPAPEVDFDRLENLTELARGGQGKVHDAPRIRINQSWPVVFKEYFPEVLARLDTSARAPMWWPKNAGSATFTSGLSTWK